MRTPGGSGWRSVVDQPDNMGRHATGSHGSNPHLGPGERRFQHLPLSEIDGNVLATAGAPEDEITTSHLRDGNTAPTVVLSSRVFREVDTDAGESKHHQA